MARREGHVPFTPSYIERVGELYEVQRNFPGWDIEGDFLEYHRKLNEGYEDFELAQTSAELIRYYNRMLTNRGLAGITLTSDDE